MWSSPDQLEALSAVVREGSFERAAAVLSITTSAVSQRVKSLESSAGRVLLRRERPVTATPAGHVLLKLATQLELIERDALRELELDGIRPLNIPISVNADSLKTWLLEPLVAAASTHGFSLDVRREDQDGAARLLRNGEVMAAISSESDVVQGCSVRPLGSLQYIAVASQQFAATWFPGGSGASSWASAPLVVYDRSDRLADRFLDQFGAGGRPPRSFIPGSWDYLRAIELGLGWGLVPTDAGSLVDLLPNARVHTDLFWHQWTIPSTQLSALSKAVSNAARDNLRPPVLF